MKIIKRCFFLSFVVLLLLSSISNAQNTRPTITPTPTENEKDVVRISTSLIQVDVTVTDKSGKIVTDLKPEDFEIYENNEKQDITNFSFVTQSSENKSIINNKQTSGQSSVPVPPVAVKPEQIRRTIALVVDDLGLSAESVHRVRQSLKKFVDEQMQPNDLVAIIRTGGGIGATQQFTNDKRLLYSAIENIKWNPLGREGITIFPPENSSATEEGNASGLPVNPAIIETEKQMTNTANTDREGAVLNGTFGALSYIVKGMSNLPGRKSIMLFSDGLKISPNESPGKDPGRVLLSSGPVVSTAGVQRDAGANAQLLEALKNLTESANRASVIIYSFDARGLVFFRQDGTASSRWMSNQIHNKQEGLKYLAKETGGRAFLNNNDFNKDLDTALEDQKGFYLLGYQPDSETFDPQKQRFNKLEVKIKRPGLNVRYRSGFFGITDDKRDSSIQAQSTPQQQILTAITSPFASNDIKLRLHTLFGNSKKSGSFVHSFLHIGAKEIEFVDEPDGWKKAVFDVLAMSFGENGLVADQLSKTYTLRLKGETYEKVAREGFVYDFLFLVKKSGAYQMRVAVRDSVNAKVGSASQFIEVPDLKTEKLSLSGIFLENLSKAQWQKTQSTSETAQLGTPKMDISLRRFKKGSILQYGLEIYNAKTDSSGKHNLQTRIRVFHNGKLKLEGELKPLNTDHLPNSSQMSFNGALDLGEDIEIGEYVLQIVVTDNLAKSNRKLATQWVQFEIAE